MSLQHNLIHFTPICMSKSLSADDETIFMLGVDSLRLKPDEMVLVSFEIPHRIQLLTQFVRLVDCFTPLRQDFLT